MIEAFTGLPGQGKTYLMTRLGLKKMRKGRTVYANYWLEGAERFNQVSELLEVRNAVILLDEAGLVAPAGSWKDIPFEVMAHWRQHRHKGVDLWYTAQDLRDVAVALRRVTQFENRVNKFGPWIRWKTSMPSDRKQKFGGGITLFDPEVARAYDTYGEDVAKQLYIRN